VIEPNVDTSWSLSVPIIVALLGYATIYVLRWRRARAEGGARAAGAGRLALWMTGLACLALALLTPVDHLGEQFASFHMIQHLLIADLAPIALTLALTKWLLRPVTRRIHRIEQAVGPLAHPVFGAVAYIGVMWFWHIPAMYDATLTSATVHTLEHLSFGAAGLLYWWHLLSPIRSRMRLGGLGPVAYMGATKILVGFVGLLLAFSPELLYDGYARQGDLWGLTALEDQQVAGAIMGLEQSITMGIALAILFVRMLTESENEQQRSERYAS
jgi:cytochrome c oxidase assembly factor CtaG